MKRRKNAVYTGQSTRGGTGTGTGDRFIANLFYARLDRKLLASDVIEIIPLEKLKPTHAFSDQKCIIADYCVRKILPEITAMFRWGAAVTPKLRALAPIVDKDTAEAAVGVCHAVADATADRMSAQTVLASYTNGGARGTAREIYDPNDPANEPDCDPYDTAEYAVMCVYYALVTCVEIGDEAAYDRIIALTNEMLESL